MREYISNEVKKLSRPDESDSDKIRVPAYIIPKDDHPGILFEILRSFYEKSINLISIMSRPTKQEMGTYNFYVEIEGEPSQSEMILETLSDISKQNGIKLLGIYPECK
jgi:prephenate dehydratase